VGFLDWLFGGKKSADTGSSVTAAQARLQPAAHFAVVDVETTGLSPTRDRVLELAIVRTDRDGNVVDEWVSRFNPEGPVGATHIHGIRDADVANAPLFRDAAPTISTLLSGLPIVAHNAKFDLAFLRAEFAAAGWDLPDLTSYCTMNGSHHFLPDLERRRLADCCWGARVQLNDAHSALGDARATAALLSEYLTMGRTRTPHRELSSLSSAAGWPPGPSRPPQHTRARAASTNSRPTPSRPAPARFTPPRPAQPSLLTQLTSLSLSDVIEEGAPAGAAAYIELLFDALEDGDISAGEAASLSDLAQSFELTQEDLHAAHTAFLSALAHHALNDGRVSTNERQELEALAELMAVPSKVVRAVLSEAEAARKTRLSARLQPLPQDWAHGEPLRVGDKVAFTGCDELQREQLERQSEQLGVRIMGNVSKMTTMLVTDGSFSGGKHSRALELGTRTVHPDLFEILLKHLQPARESSTSKPISTRAKAHPSNPSTLSKGAAVEPISSGSPFDIRAWAAANGHTVGVRGRLPREIVDAYNASRELV
jgi:DNA polymerase-3 subunit epsilon